MAHYPLNPEFGHEAPSRPKTEDKPAPLPKLYYKEPSDPDLTGYRNFALTPYKWGLTGQFEEEQELGFGERYKPEDRGSWLSQRLERPQAPGFLQGWQFAPLRALLDPVRTFATEPLQPLKDVVPAQKQLWGASPRIERPQRLKASGEPYEGMPVQYYPKGYVPGAEPPTVSQIPAATIAMILGVQTPGGPEVTGDTVLDSILMAFQGPAVMASTATRLTVPAIRANIGMVKAQLRLNATEMRRASQFLARYIPNDRLKEAMGFFDLGKPADLPPANIASARQIAQGRKVVNIDDAHNAVAHHIRLFGRAPVADQAVVPHTPYSVRATSPTGYTLGGKTKPTTFQTPQMQTSAEYDLVMPDVVKRLKSIASTSDVLSRLNAAEKSQLASFIRTWTRRLDAKGSGVNPTTRNAEFVIASFMDPAAENKRAYIISSPIGKGQFRMSYDLPSKLEGPLLTGMKPKTATEGMDVISPADVDLYHQEAKNIWKGVWESPEQDKKIFDKLGSAALWGKGEPIPENPNAFFGIRQLAEESPLVVAGKQIDEDLWARGRYYRNKSLANPKFARNVDPQGIGPRAGGASPSSVVKEMADRFLNRTIPGEKLVDRLVIDYGGATRTFENRIGNIVREGNDLLEKAGIGRMRGPFRLAREEDIPILDDLYDALHNPSKVESGQISIPEGLEDIYNVLRRETDFEQAMRVDFDPKIATLEDYFFRGWKPSEELKDYIKSLPDPLTFGMEPRFMKVRNNQSYRAMREAGFEPAFWNPFHQVTMSRRMGERYRLQMQLIDDLRHADLAHPISNDGAHKLLPAKENWRTPEIGPGFEGRAFAAALEDGSVGRAYQGRWLVPGNVARRLEGIFGKPLKLEIGLPYKDLSIDILKGIDAVTFIPKRARLFVSLHQQRDFIQRQFYGHWTQSMELLKQGQPIAAVKNMGIGFPKATASMLASNIGPGSRARLSIAFDSTTPLIKGRKGIHMRGISMKGLSNVDPTMYGALEDLPRQLADEAGFLGIPWVAKRVVDFEGAMRRGMFEGLYRAALLADIQNNIVPMTIKAHPNAADEVINAIVAKTANIKYSTIPAEQSIAQRPVVRYVLSRAFFSFGEPEALLRQATQAVRGSNSKYWRKHWIGAYVGTAIVAETIHFASTGEPLPKERFIPISTDDSDAWGFLPIGYRREFLAPTLPFKGRNQTELLLDLMAQMDTVFRVLDPLSFLTSRESVPIRAFHNQYAGTEFTGMPIDTVGPGGILSRTAALIADLGLPIGTGQAFIHLGKKTGIPGMDLFPEPEGRIGTPGHVFQGAGFNVLGENSHDLRNRLATEIYGKEFLDLEPDERKAVKAAINASGNEQDIRDLESLLRNSEYAQYKKEKAAINDTFQETMEKRYEALIVKEKRGRAFQAALSKERNERRGALKALDNLFSEVLEDLEKMEGPTSKVDIALRTYINILDTAKLEDEDTGFYDFNKKDEIERIMINGPWSDLAGLGVTGIDGPKGGFGSTIWGKVRAQFEVNNPKGVQDFYDDRDGPLKIYYEAPALVAKEYGLTDLWNAYMGQEPLLRASFRELNPDIEDILKEAKRVRDRERLCGTPEGPLLDSEGNLACYGNPDVERKLLKWGRLEPGDWKSLKNPIVQQEHLNYLLTQASGQDLVPESRLEQTPRQDLLTPVAP